MLRFPLKYNSRQNDIRVNFLMPLSTELENQVLVDKTLHVVDKILTVLLNATITPLIISPTYAPLNLSC